MKELFDTLSNKCSRITTQLYSTSFSIGIHFLNKKLHAPIYAIYGFVRLADEIVDSFHNYNKSLLLAELKKDCFAAIEARISVNPILNSFQQVVNEYHIDHELIYSFLCSMEMDLSPPAYTAIKYDEYIFGSAQAVGLMCLHVFTNNNKALYEQLKLPAMKLGAAFQKVNFLRDISADYYSLNRSYFPGVEVAAFSETAKREIENDIEQDFDDALEGIRKLPASSRLGVYMAYIYYKKLFVKIKNVSHKKILSKRVRVSNAYKCWLMICSVVSYRFNVI